MNGNPEPETAEQAGHNYVESIVPCLLPISSSAQVYMLLRQNRVTPAQLRHLERLFVCMDRDRTGKLSYEEIREGLLDVDVE